MLVFTLSAILTSLVWLALILYALRKVFNNLKHNQAAQHAFMVSVVMPIFGKESDLPMAEEEES